MTGEFFGPRVAFQVEGARDIAFESQGVVRNGPSLEVRAALERAAVAIEREADAYEAEHSGNTTTGPMYEAAKIVRGLAHG